MAELKQLIRVANTDLKGGEPLYKALTRIKGVSFMMARAVCKLANMDKMTKAGLLTEEEVQKLNTELDGMKGIPSFMYNRRKDYETGKDRHILTANLLFEKDNDIKRMKKIKSYKGVRHILGQPVRGQRTKAHFRKGKAIGVVRGVMAVPAAPTKEKPQAKPAKGEKK
jgi:small subunit ribosomal protein S13